MRLALQTRSMKSVISFVAAILISTSVALAQRPQWQEVSRGADVVVYRKEVPGSDIMAYRGVANLPVPVAKVMAVLKDTPSRTKWTDKVKHAAIIREISPFERIEYMALDAPFPVKDRDFVYRSKLEFDEKNNRAIVKFQSVEDPARPSTHKRIRGVISSGQFTIYPTGRGTGTRIEADLHADPRGHIPTWVINKVQQRAPIKTLENLKKYLASNNIPDDPLAAEFFGRKTNRKPANLAEKTRSKAR